MSPLGHRALDVKPLWDVYRRVSFLLFFFSLFACTTLIKTFV